MEEEAYSVEIDGSERPVTVAEMAVASVTWGGWQWEATHADRQQAWRRLFNRVQKRNPFFGALDWGSSGKPVLIDGVPADIHLSIDPLTRKRMVYYAEQHDRLLAIQMAGST